MKTFKCVISTGKCPTCKTIFSDQSSRLYCGNCKLRIILRCHCREYGTSLIRVNDDTVQAVCEQHKLATSLGTVKVLNSKVSDIAMSRSSGQRIIKTNLPGPSPCSDEVYGE